MHNRILFRTYLVLALNLAAVPGQSAQPVNTGGVPVVYCSDLFHPHGDPDDHFDLATLFALPELDVKAILLDQGAHQAKNPGRIPVEQMLRLTGRRVPCATGLAEKLKSPTDAAREQPKEAQGAVELFLKTLREAKQPVTYIGTGSARDICAAFNREPELLKRKLARVYVSIGNADNGGREWNVDLDPKAFAGLLRSGLPVYWCPCFPIDPANTNAVFATYWKFRHAEVLEGAPRSLQNFFIYALQTVSPAELDPLKALQADLRLWRHLVWKMERNMWSTPALLHAAGRNIYRVDDKWYAFGGPPRTPNAQKVELFTFVPARVEVDDTGMSRKFVGVPDANVKLFKVTDPSAYGVAMRGCLADLLGRFPVTTR